METLLGVLLGTLALHVFYRALEVGWPTSYFSVSSNLDRAVSIHPTSYLAFRVGPVLAVLIFVGVSVERSDGRGAAAILATAALHGSLTSGRAIARLIRRKSSTDAQRSPLIALHAGVLGLLAMTAAAATAYDQELEVFIPEPDQVASDLWTAVAAATLGAYLVKVASGRSQAVNEVVARSQKSIPEDLWSLLRREAEAHGTDPALASAIMVAENLQRPRWFRKLERLKGVVWKEGTYGIMQVAADSPIGDEESIRRAIQGPLAGITVPRVEKHWGSSIDSDALTRIAMSYNPDPAFAATVCEVYWQLSRSSRPETTR